MINILEQLGFNINVEKIVSSSVALTYWVVAILIIIGVIALIYWIMSFNNTVLIKEPIGKAYEYKDDKGESLNVWAFRATIHRAKIKKLRNVYSVQLFAPYKSMKLPDKVFHAVTKRGKKYFEFVKLSEHIYAPTLLLENETVQHIYDESLFRWVVHDIEQDAVKYGTKTFWDQYGQFIMSAATLVLCLIIIVATLKYAQDYVDKAAKSFGQLTNVLIDAIKEAKQQQI